MPGRFLVGNLNQCPVFRNLKGCLKPTPETDRSLKHLVGSYEADLCNMTWGVPKLRKSGKIIESLFYLRDLYGCEPKIVGKPKMDGENHGKPYEQMDDLGGFNPLFLETSVLSMNKKSSLWIFSQLGPEGEGIFWKEWLLNVFFLDL